MLDFESVFTGIEGIGAKASISLKKPAARKPPPARKPPVKKPAPRKPTPAKKPMPPQARKPPSPPRKAPPKSPPKKQAPHATAKASFSAKAAFAKPVAKTPSRRTFATVATTSSPAVKAIVSKSLVPKAPVLFKPPIVLKAASVAISPKPAVPTAMQLATIFAEKKNVPVTPAIVQSAQKLLNAREEVAVKMAGKIVDSLAAKTPEVTSEPTEVTSEVEEKATQAVAPIAQACKCGTTPVLSQLEKNLTKDGYPPGTATRLLSTYFDMNEKLGKAAVQKLETHNHEEPLTDEHEFRHQVLAKLAFLSEHLPMCHPVRTRANLAILKKA